MSGDQRGADASGRVTRTLTPLWRVVPRNQPYTVPPYPEYRVVETALDATGISLRRWRWYLDNSRAARTQIPPLIVATRRHAQGVLIHQRSQEISIHVCLLACMQSSGNARARVPVV